MIYPLIQLLPVSAEVAALVGGRMHVLYTELPSGVAFDSAYLSLDIGVTLSGFIRQCSLFAVFFAVLALTTTASRLEVLLTVILLVGFVEALYGLLVYFGGGELGLWDPGHSQSAVSGTYVNQNHFAGLMEMTIPAGLGLLLSFQSERVSPSGVKGWTRAMSVFILSRRGALLFCLVIMLAALILTSSRGGTAAIAIGLTVAILIAVSRKDSRATALRLAVIVISLALVAVLWLGVGQFSRKLQTGGLDSNRSDLREVSYAIIGDSPLIGTGLGTYRWVFPSYKDERFGGNFYEHAHNDYLEILGEQGLAGFSLLALSVVLIYVRLLRTFRQRCEPLRYGALFAAIAGTTSLLVHGLVDFNLQIPANAFYFFVLLALGMVACTVRRESATGRPVYNR
jgi:O-antigen ligase